MTVAVVGEESSSVRSVQSHTASLVVLADTMYLVSTGEIATVDCFLEDHKTELPAISKIKLLVDL